MTNSTIQSYDIIIAGGGMVGASMAIAAAQQGFNIALIEKFPLNSDAQPSFDERTVALTYSSYKIFQSLGVWQNIKPYACAIDAIEVSNQGHWGFTHLDKHDAETETLGFVVGTRHIGQSLYQAISELDNIKLFCPASAISCEKKGNHTSVSIELDNEQVLDLSAKCLVIADGGRSALMEQLNIKSNNKPYTQKALISIVAGSKPHNNKAFEHFINDGPLALLPYKDQDYALVWTAMGSELDLLQHCSDDEFLTKLNTHFKHRLAPLTKVGSRHVYPLSFGHIQQPTEQRIAIIGNAAHLVHPVAGQGFNLGLRDVADLLDTFKEFKNNTLHDIGSEIALQQFADKRQRDTKMVGIFTDGLIKSFTSRNPAVILARNLGLSAINLMPATKKRILHRSMGIHRQTSTLINELK